MDPSGRSQRSPLLNSNGSCHTRDRDRDVARSGSSSSGRPELLVQQGAEGDWLTNGGRVGGRKANTTVGHVKGCGSRDTPLCCDGRHVRARRADFARGVPFRAVCEAVAPCIIEALRGYCRTV